MSRERTTTQNGPRGGNFHMKWYIFASQIMFMNTTPANLATNENKSADMKK